MRTECGPNYLSRSMRPSLPPSSAWFKLLVISIGRAASAQPDSDGIVIGGDPETNERDLVILTVTNRGGAPTTIEGMHVWEFRSRGKADVPSSQDVHNSKSAVEGGSSKRPSTAEAD